MLSDHPLPGRLFGIYPALQQSGALCWLGLYLTGDFLIYFLSPEPGRIIKGSWRGVSQFIRGAQRQLIFAS